MGRKYKSTREDPRRHISRRVQKIGSTSLVVTLPKAWAHRFDIRPGDKLLIVDEGYQLRVLPPRDVNRPPIKIRLKRGIDMSLMNNILLCLYTRGFSSIALSGLEENEASTLFQKVKQDASDILEISEKREDEEYTLKFYGGEDEDPLNLTKKYVSELYSIFELIASTKIPDTVVSNKLSRSLEELALTALKINRARVYSYNSKGLCENLPFALNQLAKILKILVLEASMDETSWRILSDNADNMKILTTEILGGLIYSSWKRLDIGLKLMTDIREKIRKIEPRSCQEAKIIGKIEMVISIVDILTQLCACNIVFMDLANR